jgi:prohibitin 2
MPSSRRLVRILVPSTSVVALIAILVTRSIRIIDAGNRGVLLNFSPVDISKSLKEGIHFVVPLRDEVVQMGVRTQKIMEDKISASKDLPEVKTQVALNYHLDPENVQVLYLIVGLDYTNRIIIPAIQESVKQVTTRFNAEELITKREMVKNEIEEQIRAWLVAYNIAVNTISITEFQFSDEFVKAVEEKVAFLQ